MIRWDVPCITGLVINDSVVYVPCITRLMINDSVGCAMHHRACDK